MNEPVFMFQLESKLIATLNYFISHEILNYLRFFPHQNRGKLYTDHYKILGW